MKFPCNVILPCVWAIRVSLKEEFPTDAVYPVMLAASGQPDTSMLLEKTVLGSHAGGVMGLIRWQMAG